MRSMRGVVVVAATLFAAACQNSSSSGSAPQGATSAAPAASAATAKDPAKPAAAAPATDKPAETKLDKLGLKADLPAMSQVSDGVSAGSVMVIGTAPVNIAAAKPDDPKTVDDAKKDAKDFDGTNFKDEKLADGWSLTYENTGSLGTNYWLVVRREIGGKAYKCDTSVNSEDQRKAALAICKSLRQ